MQFELPEPEISATGETGGTPSREQIKKQISDLKQLPDTEYFRKKIARLENLLDNL